MANEVIDLSALANGQGFVIVGDQASDHAGSSVSGAGDVNGDGIDDLIVGADNGDDGGLNAGEAYVIFGTAGATRDPVYLSQLGSNGFVIQGDEVDDLLGDSVSGAGDVNGDGIDDLIVGARHGDDGGGNAGEAYVVFGKAGTIRSNIDLSSLGDQGFIIQGVQAGDNTGWSVSGAGDVNGDGINDLIVGAPYGNDGDVAAGEAYVIFGKAGATRSNIDFSSLGDQGFIVQGNQAGANAGSSVSAAGDFNHDGIDDLIVGTYAGNGGGDYSGEAYVIFGKAGATRGNIDLSSLGDEGVVIIGDQPEDNAGRSVSAAGDVNADGVDDLIIGAPNGDGSAVNVGKAYIIFGGTGGESNAPPVVAPESNYSTSVNTLLNFSIDAVDPDGDPLTFNADQPLHGTLAHIGNSDYAYRPDAGFFGIDSFSITVSDGKGGSAEQSVEVSVTVDDDWRLFARDGYAGDIGGTGTVIGTNGHQDIGVIYQPGVITFDASFNRGGDVIRMDGDASNWNIVLSGSNAVFLFGECAVTVPVGFAGLLVTFDDGDRLLRYDSTTDSVLIGDQVFGTTPEQITAPAQNQDHPASETPNSFARLFLAENGSVSVDTDSRIDIYGTAASEFVYALSGEIRLGASFNRGGDLLVLSQPATDFTAVQTGSSIELVSATTDVFIPLGTEGMTISFAGEQRILVFDMALDSALIGNQQIGYTVVPLSEFA